MGISAVGCVRFDVDDPNLGGWASVGGKTPYRISSVGNLDNDTLWWTSLSFRAVHEANLHKTPYIKQTTYLNSWLPDGQEEFCRSWGFERRTHSEDQITQALSAVLRRVFEFSQHHYGIDLRHGVPVHGSLADEIRCQLLPERDPHIAPEVDAALSAAHQYYTHCLTAFHNRDETIAVRLFAPAASYAQEMLSAGVPVDQVDFVGEGQLPQGMAGLDWILGLDQPALAKVRVSNVHPEYVNVIAFANGAKAGSNRAWVTQPELLLLSKYADVEVSAAFVFRGFTAIPEKCRLPKLTSMQAMTPTADVVLTNHWIGLARENCYRLEPKATPHRAVSPRAAWLTALDRFWMFSYALQLHRAGLVVRKYGAGSVIVVVPKHNYKEAYEIATEIGLLAPPNFASDVEMQREMHSYG